MQTTSSNGRPFPEHRRPHAVAFLDSLEGADIVNMGAYLRYHDSFSPKGTNANFAECCLPATSPYAPMNGEWRTKRCLRHRDCQRPDSRRTDGCSFPHQSGRSGWRHAEVGFTRTGDHFTNVTLTGPADLVFEGDIEV